MEAPVLVVGAGPTGLVAAIDLARRGIGVRIIEKAPTPFQGSRGKGLQPRTLEVFDDLGVVDRILAIGRPYPPIRVHLGRFPVWRSRMKPASAPTPQTPYPNLLMVPQFHTESILRGRLAELGVEVEYGAELTGLNQDDGGVTATIGGKVARFAYAIGADGGRSFVRKAIGVAFEGETRSDERMVVADVRLQGLDRRSWRAYVDPLRGRFRLALAPLTGTDLFQYVAPLRPDEDPDLGRAALQERAFRAGARRVEVTEVAWASVWRANVRLAERYRVGRVLLAGDAAHVHSPAGGQGLNTGVQDAYNLGWKLAAVLQGADEGLLDTYEQERMPVAAAVLGMSSRYHDEAKRDGARKAFQRGAETDQLGIHYRESPMSHGPQAGERAADGLVQDLDGHEHRLFDLFRGPHWTLLTTDPATDRGRFGPDVRVEVVRDLPFQARNVLVRPDGYIGLTSADASDVEAYAIKIKTTCRHGGAG